MGADAPLLYDIFGRLENLSFGIKAYLPFRAGAASDPGFGGGTRIAFNISYKFRL